MTYDDIATWADVNFPVESYFDPSVFIADVKKRFEADNMFFPAQAGRNLRDLWVERITGFKADDIDVRGPEHETLDDIRADYRSRFPEYFKDYVEEPEQDIIEVMATPPPVIQNLPNPEQQVQQNRAWRAGGFRDLASRIWNRIRRRNDEPTYP